MQNVLTLFLRTFCSQFQNNVLEYFSQCGIVVGVARDLGARSQDLRMGMWQATKPQMAHYTKL